MLKVASSSEQGDTRVDVAGLERLNESSDELALGQ